MVKVKTLCWVLTTCFVLGLLGCNAAEETKVLCSIDRHTSDSIEAVLENAQIVVIGSFGEELEERNMARMVGNPTQEHYNIISMAKLYTFYAEAYLAGEGGPIITVALPCYMGTRQRPDYYQDDPDFFNPLPGKKVVVFLTKGNPDDCWFPATQPFAFNVSGEMLEVIAPQEQIRENFIEPISFANLRHLLEAEWAKRQPFQR